jgi:excisionase family DNA binding protein
MMDKPPSIMTITEAADYLRVSRSSLYKLAQGGKIPCQKVGRHWRFHRVTLENWISRPWDFKDMQLIQANSQLK